MKDLEDQKRLEAAKAQREQMENERAAQQTEQTQETEQSEETQPSLDFDQILNDNGNVVLVDVLGKDGNTKYPSSQLFLIRDSGAKAKVMELKSDGTLVPHAVNKKDVRTATTMTLDEYKQAMAESSMIEENSGENRGEIEVETPAIEGETAAPAEEAAAPESAETPATEQTPGTPAMTLEDGTIVPMLEDGNPDFSKLTADQTAELYDSQFGEDADSVISGWVSDAKKALDKANNMTVKGKNFVEQKAAKEAKEKAIADAQAAYDSAVAIRDAYNERQLAKVEDTAEGRKILIEKARRKFSRLKSAVKDDAEAVSQLYKDVVGSLLHRLYDGTGIDVTDTIPLTAEEYVASNLGAHSLNYEGTETSKGVKQETGLSREDFAKTQLLAADGKGTTIDDLVHSLWENRPSNLESLDTQDIRNALIGVLTSGFKASEARNYIENLRIAQAENILEEQKKAADNAAFAEEQKANQEEEEKKSEENEKINEQTNENINTPELSHEQQKAMEDGEKLGFPAFDKEGEPINEYVIELANWAKEQGLEIDPTSKSNSYADLFLMCKDGFGVSTLVPDEGENINQVVYFPDNVQDFDQLWKLQEEFNAGRDLKHSSNIDSEITEGATFYDADTAREFKEFVDKKVEEQNKVFGEQRPEEDLPFSAKENGKQQTTAERAADVEKNKVDDMKVVDNIVGQKTRKTFERLAKMMGANIQWQYSDKLGNGWIQETTDSDGNVHRTIFITLDSSITEGAQFIFGHEMTHQIKRLNPASYNELTQLVLDTYGSDAFDKAIDETMKRYSDAGFSGRARDYYAEEVVADAVGEMIRDLNLAHTLAMKMSHPLLAAIHEILQKIKLAFFGTEYSDVTKNIIRSIEQAYVKTANGEVTNSETGEDVSFSLRQKPEPKKKGVGYKVFVLKDGKLYPPMVANPDGAATPVGVWLDADAAPIAGESKTGRPQVKQGGKGTQGGSGKLAYRPGWHLGVVPYAIQFNRKDADGNKTLFPKNFVFAEVEYAADVDYQEEARQEGINPSGKYQHSLAGLKHLPTDGYYMYRTNPNPETDPWVITGAMKVNRILTRAEQAELVKNAGREPQQIQEGDIITDDVVNSINQEIADAPKFSLKDIKPVGVGAFGNIYNQFRGNAKAAIEFLKKVRGGEAVGALHHKDIGDIDLVWGKEGTGHSDGYGLSKLVKYHPEVLDNLQEILNDMRVVSSSKNRVNLESETHKAGVRLTWDGERKSWLLTAFKKETSASDKRTDTAATSLEGDTALSQTEGSAAKIDNSSETTKENGEKFSLKDEKTLAGVHNITEEKLRKALKLGGFANPSIAVIDTSKSGHDNFGEISFIAPSALLDKRTGNTGGTWITDAYTQRYPSVEREMSEKGRQKFNDWVDSLEYPAADKAEIKRQTEDALSNNNAPAWELMYLKEKGIDIKEYDSRIDYRWKEIIRDHPTAEDILSNMQNDPELNEKVTSLAKHAIIHPTWEKVSLEVRRKMYKETGVKASPINPQVRKQTKEIFERDYKSTLLNKDGSPRKKDVKKVVEDIVKEHNDTKKYDFYLSKVKASNYVNKNGLYDDYIRWQENKLDEFGTKNRIFRGYTKDGSRKYVPETLENVSKAMREEADGQTNGSEYTSFGSFIAKLASRVDSTDEMRANKDKLSSNKDKEEFYEKWNEVYYELAKFLYNDVFYGEQRLHDIVLQADPKKYAKKEYGITLTPTFMKKLDALKNAVQTELKSAYFETKYNRPLRLNEFAAAVVPDNLGEDVRKGIENAGLPLYNYDPNKEGDRSRAFNDAVNSSDNIRFSLAGERGAAASDKAEERTARMDNLSVARKMEEEKKDAKAIKMATGWERGADGKWRYEMPDAKIKDTMDVGGGHIVKRYEDDMLWNGGKLSKVIDAPELFKAYPQLKDVRIDTDAIMNDMPSNGEYNSKTNTITIHADELKYMNSILNHEIQHVIQDIEGFAKGGSPRLVRGEVKKKLNEVTKQIRQLRAEGKEDEAKALIEKNRGLYNAYQKNDDYNSYKSLAGEVEARNVSARMNMTPEERRKTLAESTEDVARKDQIFLGVGDVSFSLRDMADGKESGAADMAEDLKSLNTPDEVDDAIKTAIEDMPSGWKMANKKMIHVAQALGENRKAEIAGEEPKFSLKDGTLIKAGTYFSGGGLVEEGLKGIIDPVVAVEYDEKISGVYRNNFGQHIVTADVRDVDPRELVKQIDGEVEYFHASPVCKNYSQAKSNHTEVELDKETAASTAEFINAVKPKVVTIENVKGYKDSEAMKIITDALDANGYTWDADVYNAADYGGYTNRERLIVRAVRDGKLPAKPKKMARKSGWYEAVADIIPTLTEKKNGVASWMDVRLKADGIDWRNIDKPLYVMGSAYADGKVPHAFADELLPTLRTKSGDVIVMPDGKVYRAMGRVLARVSGVSDDYKMPFSENLSHTIIGNGIPTQLTEHVIAPLLTGSDPKFSLKKINNVKDSRVIPTDVDKNVSSQIEKKFDDEIEKIKSETPSRDLSRLEDELDYYLFESSTVVPTREALKDRIKYFEDEAKQEITRQHRWNASRGNSGENNANGESSFALSRSRAAIATYRRELAYREARIEAIRNRLGMQSDGEMSLSTLVRYYKGSDRGRNAETDRLFDKALDIVKRLGVEFNVYEGADIRNPKREGVSSTDRRIELFLEGMARTELRDNDFTHTILHEMLHQATVGSINLVKKGKAEGFLTPKQIEGVNEILEIYDKVKDDKERFKENTYGLTDAYELTAQMADLRQRKAMGLTIWDKVVNAAHEFARKGDRSILQRLKDAWKKLFEVSDKDKMDKAINDIMDDFKEKIDDISMNNIEETDFGLNGNTRFSLRYDQFEHDLNQWKKDNNLPKDAQRPTIPQRNAGESAVDFLRRVDEYRKQMALWKTAPTYEQHLLSDDTALGEFNRELQRGSVLKRIAFQDSMLAIRKAQEAIMKEVGVDRLNMAEDAYTAENRSHGKGKNEFEEYNNEFLQPLRKAYHQMKKVLGDSYDNVRVYMMAKHGLERDAQMAFKKSLEADYEDVNQRSAAYKAYKNDLDRVSNDADLEFGRVDFTTWRQKDNALRGKYSPSYMDYRYDDNGIAYDYSGLSSLFDGSDFEEAAHRLVRDVETKHLAEVQALWNATNAATKKILRDGFKAGMMSKDAYEYVKGMYSHYIPLRGLDGTTADQVWDYIGGGKGAFNQTLKTAHGRTSIADDPIAYIENMAESGILLNNKNWVKHHLMLLAQNHPTSLLTLSKAWYVKSTDANGNEEWIPATPQITSQMNSNQVKAAIDAFEQKMEQLAQTGDATQQRDGLNIAYPQTHSEEREHEVRVMKDGEEYVIYVNGDPQLAQAMNNTRAHRVREIQSGKLDRAAAWLGRKMAAAYTSLSPLFIPSNYFRDLTMTLASTAIREDGRYNYLLRKNLATSWNLGFMLRDYQNGKLREKVSNGNATPKEQMFYDFMMNGGETGFVSSLDVEDLKKKFKNDLKDLDRWKANPVKVGHTIMDSIEFLNRMIEDSNRFAVYMTSIQYGRSIDEAVNDAKDVTLNFNRKGTGEYGWQMIRNLYLFINPAVQSLQTLGALTKHHPFKFTAVTAAWLASGVLVPIVNAALMSLLGGDDDKDKYWQFSKWDRRNNAIMWIPFTNEYVKIPLAQEFRAFYGIGDMIASKMMGGELAEETWSQYAEDLLGQVVDMLPLDPTGYDGNIAVSLMPNPIRPVFELAFNVDFTGKPLFKETEYNKYDPNFTKAYVGTPDWLVRVSKMVNSIGNDYPDVQQNAIDAFGDPRYNLDNPAVVDHVLSSYLGGAYTMGSQVLGVLTKSLNDPKEIKVADIPLVSKFVSNPDDRPVTKKQGDEFWNMKENHDRAANTLSKLKKQAKVDGDYSMLERFYGSEEYKLYKQDDVKVKKYEEDKKKERSEESGEEYRPHKLNAEDIYKAHATPKDDFEDLKLKQLYTKLNGFKTSYDLLLDTAPSQSDGYYNTNKAAIDAIDEISLDKQEISELKKGFLEDGKDAYNAEDMKRIRELRKRILSVLEPANKVVVANQKAKAEK